MELIKPKRKKLIRSKHTKNKKKLGRPTKYRPEYCKKMIDWFDRELTILKEVEKSEYGKIITINEEKPNKPPMFGEFARKELKIHHSTLHEWRDKYDEFSAAYTECKQIQKEFIIMGCLMGHLSSTFGRFTMKNISDWRDQVETSVSQDKNGLKLAYSLGNLQDDTASN